jgi:hypothetical protein
MAFLARGIESVLSILAEVPENQRATIFMDLVENECAGKAVLNRMLAAACPKSVRCQVHAA